jgi:hypothetical protein
VKGGLSPGQADSVDPSPALPQAFQDDLPGKIGVLFRMEDQLMVVTERTAQIAGRKKKDRNHSSGPVGKGGLYKALDGIGHKSDMLSAISRQLVGAIHESPLRITNHG